MMSLSGYLGDRVPLAPLTAACHLIQLAGFVIVLRAESGAALFLAAAIIGFLRSIPPILQSDSLARDIELCTDIKAGG